MKILVTGREGQVARSIAERAAAKPSGDEFVFVARPEFDLAQPETIAAMVTSERPDVVVSAAAWTAVDLAEDEPDAARACNGVAAGAIGEAACSIGARVIHLSTDYVFAGTGDRAYVETDQTGPTSVYGRSKLEGENLLRQTCPAHVIARTAWVYSPYGKNFVKTMLNLAATRDELMVVDDQHGNPTSALDIADGILAILDSWRAGHDTGLGETFHLAGSGEASWFDLASHVLGESARLGGPTAKVSPVTSNQYPTKARRPNNSRLDCSKFSRIFGYKAPEWRVSSAAIVHRLLQP